MTTTEIILALGMVGSWIFAYFKSRQEGKKGKREDVQELIDILQRTKQEQHEENEKLRNGGR